MATGLATRCTACGTTFRVVPDQLRVSGGYVRCGRCGGVFNALEELVDLETGERRGGLELDPGGASVVGDGRGFQPDAELEIAHPAPRPTDTAAAPTSAQPPASPPASPPPPLAARAAELPRHAEPPASTQPVASSTLAPEDDIPGPAAGDAPSFVVSADRAARWRSPRMRALLLSLSALGALGLGGQVAHEYRDVLAARYPDARPLLETACAALGCRVEAARSIESLSVESSGLVRVEKSNLYRLQVALRNRATLALAVPALDVMLTDTQGRVISRKVLKLADLGTAQATIPAGQELGVQATLQAQGEAAAQPFAGYTIELFYP
jgi:predicted Zn finger-like uncharacterized protein